METGAAGGDVVGTGAAGLAIAVPATAVAITAAVRGVGAVRADVMAVATAARAGETAGAVTARIKATASTVAGARVAAVEVEPVVAIALTAAAASRAMETGGVPASIEKRC